MAHLGGREGGERLQQPLHELEEQGEPMLRRGGRVYGPPGRTGGRREAAAATPRA
jgi:hypothetical protein